MTGREQGKFQVVMRDDLYPQKDWWLQDSETGGCYYGSPEGGATFETEAEALEAIKMWSGLSKDARHWVVPAQVGAQ